MMVQQGVPGLDDAKRFGRIDMRDFFFGLVPSRHPYSRQLRVKYVVDGKIPQIG